MRDSNYAIHLFPLFISFQTVQVISQLLKSVSKICGVNATETDNEFSTQEFEAKFIHQEKLRRILIDVRARIRKTTKVPHSQLSLM